MATGHIGERGGTISVGTLDELLIEIKNLIEKRAFADIVITTIDVFSNGYKLSYEYKESE